MVSNKTNRRVRNDVSDVLFTSVKRMLSRRSTPWVGTMTELNSAVLRVQGNNAQEIASSPSALRVTLNKVVNRLRNAGVSVRFLRSTNKARTRLVKFSV